jgi:hypothetical protein
MPKSTLSILTIALAPAYLYAVDGEVLISQATVNAAGGFPYVISNPGSYKLSGNLILTDLSKDAIVIAHDFVTLDFGGFSIIGPNDCSSGSCTPFPKIPKAGVTTKYESIPLFNITIRNGTIQGMGFGIRLSGDSNTVENMNIRSNYYDGITLLRPDIQGSLQRVHGCNVNLNNVGIIIDGGQINSNNVSGNRGSGIAIGGAGALVNHNVVIGNLGVGLTTVRFFFSANNNITVSYNDNIFKNNVTGDVAVFNLDPGLALVNTGQNVCESSLCPYH